MPEATLQLFGGDWTEQKLDAVDRYLRAWAMVMKRQPFRRVYIDAFAGTGYREQKARASDGAPSMFDEDLAELAAPEPQRFLDGSARKALQVQPPFDHFLFIENKNAKIAELERLRTEFPQHAIDIREGDANVTIGDVCRSWDRGSRAVLFLDPYGMQVNWDTLEAVAKTGCIDTWILFPFAANRLMPRSLEKITPQWRARLNAMFGTIEWEQRFYREHAVADIFGEDLSVVEKRLTLQGLGAFYHERLREIFPKVAPNPRVLRSTRNRPLFQLFCAAANPGRGGDIAIKISSHILEHI